MIIVFAGLIGNCGSGGQAWAYMQYLAGLKDLGHDVYYLEDCPENFVWDSGHKISDIDFRAEFIGNCLKLICLGDRWIVRVGDRSKGMEIDKFRDICSQADLLIARANPLSSWREEYNWPRRRVFIDVDPGFTQAAIANQDPSWIEPLKRYEHLFTIGHRVGAADSLIPAAGFKWEKILPPVSLEYWHFSRKNSAACFTSVVRLNGPFGGADCQRRSSFENFLDLPKGTSQKICFAVRDADREFFEINGWNTLLAEEVARTPGSYQEFIENSRAEFLLAKEGYVTTRSGWFSDRSVCYLAACRPVLMQDTGLNDWLPTGEGVVTFTNLTEAIEGIESINADYERHRCAARRLAEEYFATGQVFSGFLETAMS